MVDRPGRPTRSTVVLQIHIDLVARRLQQLVGQHRKSLIAGAVALLAGFGITAVAVAPLANDSTPLVQRLVTEAVVPQGLDAQLEALSAQELSLTRSDITRSIDTPESLLARLGVRDPAAVQMLRHDRIARSVLAGRGGKMVQAKTGPDGGLLELVARFPAAPGDQARTHFTRLSLRQQAGQWSAEMQAVPYGTQVRLASGSIRSSLFAATDEAGLPDGVASQLADIFAADIDFHRELRKGDTFNLVYEALTADGEPVAWQEGAGRVLAAEFVNAGRTHQAMWFVGGDGRGSYYGADGRSRKRAFLASPVEFSRVTSGFAMRMHPVLQRMRQHNGVDYGAPVGTPVRSVADGVVEFAGTQNGYGKVIEVRHGKDRTTLYAHLSSMAVTKGQRIEQGQHLGAVGMTGMTTGPHLHFEFRVNGVHQDPLLVARAADTLPVDAAARPRFDEMARAVQVKLDVAESLSGRRARFE
jgi:murein DD-endopeptidase MepM/ murein hydrolase activator NlpD